MINLFKDKIFLITILAILFWSAPIFLSFFIYVPLFLQIILWFLGGVFIFLRPEVGLIVLISLTMIFIHYFGLTPITIASQTFKIYPLDLVLIFSFIGVLFQSKNIEKKPLKLYFLDIAVIFFIILSSVYFLSVLKRTDINLAIAFSSFKNYAFYVLVYFLFIFTINTDEKFKRFIGWFRFISYGLLVFVAFGFLRGSGLWTEFTPLSTEGVRYLSFAHSFYLTLAVCLNLPILFYTIYLQFPGVFLLLAQIFGIVVSLMRHLWVSLFGAFLVIWFFLYKREKKHWLDFIKKGQGLLLIIFSIIFLGLWLFPFSSITKKTTEASKPIIARINSIINLENFKDDSLNWRIYSWKLGEKAWLDNFWFGAGLGKVFFLQIENFETNIYARDLHNSWLVLLVNLGMLGFLFFEIILIVTFFYLVKILQKNNEFFPYVLGTMSMLVAFIIGAFWQPYLETNLMVVFFWIIIAMTRYLNQRLYE